MSLGADGRGFPMRGPSVVEITKSRARYFVTSFSGVYSPSRDNVDALLEHPAKSFAVLQIAQRGAEMHWSVTCIAGSREPRRTRLKGVAVVLVTRLLPSYFAGA